VLGAYELVLSGIGTDNMTSTLHEARFAPGNASLTASASSGLVFEQVSASSFVEGVRGQGGERYVSFTFRVRNGTGGVLNNVVMVLGSTASTIGGTNTPLTSLKKFDGTAADPAIAPQVIPTGAVALGSDLVTMQALYPDVLQVFTEAETAAITGVPVNITNVFPYGYVVRSANSNANRTLPVPADANDFGGLMTVSFRLPLQPSGNNDVFGVGFSIIAVSDTETKLTESIEESQDTAAVRRLRDRATLLGATTVTVLNGSPAMDPAVPDYPGQRQICSPRTAGTSASPTHFIVDPGAYSQLIILNPGESLDACLPYFRSGSGRPATNVSYQVTVKAMDRYGNQRTGIVDTVHLANFSGPPVTLPAASALVSGSAPMIVTFTNYGTSQLQAIGRRLKGMRPILVAGVTRTWTANAGTTNWNTDTNWNPIAVPMSLDSVYIPVAAPLDPALVSNVQVAGVTVEDVALIALGAFDLTATANVFTGTSGGITNTSGRLFLAGIAQSVQGRVPVLRVTGTYSLSGNLTARAPIQVDAGRLTVSAFRLQADSN